MLCEWFEADEHDGPTKSLYLIDQVHETGLEPVEPPPLLPPFTADDIELLCWMGIEAENSGEADSWRL